MEEEKIIEKIIEEGAKNSIGKIVEGINSFISKICSPAAEEFGLLLQDKVKFYRLKNLFRIMQKTEKFLAKQNVNELKEVSPKVLKEFIEEASWVEDDDIQKLWAGLLAGTISNSVDDDDATIYINLLKQLSSYEARIFDLIYRDPRIVSVTTNEQDLINAFYPQNELRFSYKTILSKSPKPLDYIISGVGHEELLNSDSSSISLAFGYIIPKLESMKRHGLLKDWKTSMDKYVIFHPTSVGLDLFMRCSGLKLYPLGAYVVTRQYWSKKENIDCFSWSPDEE